jgi:hypothetical protein
MPRMIRRALAAVSLSLLAVVGSGIATPTYAADPTLPFNWNINASTTLAKLHLTVNVPTGTFAGSVDLATGALTGDITLPPAKKTISIAGIGLATATFQMAEAKPITGTVNLSTLQVTSTATFNIKVASVYALGIPINLVGNSCTTSSPVSVTMSGTASLTGSSSFSGTYTIPLLKTCGLLTPALNLLIPGPGNTFNATASPKT